LIFVRSACRVRAWELTSKLHALAQGLGSSSTILGNRDETHPNDLGGSGRRLRSGRISFQRASRTAGFRFSTNGLSNEKEGASSTRPDMQPGRLCDCRGHSRRANLLLVPDSAAVLKTTRKSGKARKKAKMPTQKLHSQKMTCNSLFCESF
jgi:hypothetical protein